MPSNSLIEVPFTDARAADLCYALGLDRLEALKVSAFEIDALKVELRILGCSHQVIVESDDLVLQASETVACLPAETLTGTDAQTCLPAIYEETWGEVRYRMTSRVETLWQRTEDSLDGLIREHDRSPHGVVGMFPGHPYAFTALKAFPLRLVPGLPRETFGLAWQTFHAYPQTDELVHTTSTLEIQPR